MQGERTDNVIRLQRHPDGVGALDTPLCAGRYEIVTAGNDLSLGFIGGDPYKTNAFTGLIVPSAPSSSIGDARYLFMLARAQFQTGERGVRLVGIRQYVDLVAQVTSEDIPPQIFHKEILSPMFRPPDGNISWHVMIIDKTWRDTRNPANADGFIYQDSYSPALLYQVAAPYAPPNAGRPWGTAIGASLGNIHDSATRGRKTPQSTRSTSRFRSRAMWRSLRASVRTIPRPTRAEPDYPRSKSLLSIRKNSFLSRSLHRRSTDASPDRSSSRRISDDSRSGVRTSRLDHRFPRAGPNRPWHSRCRLLVREKPTPSEQPSVR